MKTDVRSNHLSHLCQTMKGYFYFASPYTSPDPAVRHARYEEARLFSFLLFQRGIFHFAPIVACHDVAVKHGMPTDFKFWEDFNMSLILPSIGIIIADIDGWQESRGVTDERNKALELRKPIYFCSRQRETYLTFLEMEK